MLKRLKGVLKKITFMRYINAIVKARQSVWKFNKLEKYYSARAKTLGVTYNASDIATILKKSLESRGIFPNSKQMGKLRIFYVGANLPQDESGFLQGLQSFGEVIIFKNEDSGYGLAGSHADQRSPSIRKVIESNNRILLEQVKRTHNEGKIDLFLGQMWADVLDVETLREIQKMGIPTVNISMDDKLADLWGSYLGRRMGSVGLVSGLDFVLTTTEVVCKWYAVEGCPAIYWPLASDPNIFYPRKEKKHDVVFVGSNYGLRGKLVEAIIAAGINITAFGPGWPNGPIGAEKSAEVFGEAKIILGTGTIGYNNDVFTIKLRDFDAPMAGALYITHRNPDLLTLFKEGEEIECYLTFDECIEKIKFYLTNPDKLNKIANAGFLRARRDHTWEKRIGDTFRLIGILS